MRHVPFSRRLLALLVLAACIAPATTASATPALVRAADPGPTTWGIAPSGSDSRAAFAYAVDPGQTVRDVVVVSNYGEEELTVSVYASDAVTQTGGAFDVLPATQKPVEVGAWVDLGKPTTTIAPRSKAEIPFRINVPDNATPGDHAGGIVASVTSQASGTGGGRLSVDRRVGARIYLRVSGTVDPVLTVSGLRASFDGGPWGLPGVVRVDYLVRNEGNLRLSGRPVLQLTGPLGLGAQDRTGDVLPELLPGDSIQVSTVIDDVTALGRYDVDVEIRPYSSGTQLLDLRPTGRATTTLWALPWASLAVLLLALALLLWHRSRVTAPKSVTTDPVSELSELPS